MCQRPKIFYFQPRPSMFSKPIYPNTNWNFCVSILLLLVVLFVNIVNGQLHHKLLKQKIWNHLWFLPFFHSNSSSEHKSSSFLMFVESILYTHTHMNIYIYTHTHTYIYTHIYTYIYTHTHTHIYIYSSSSWVLVLIIYYLSYFNCLLRHILSFWLYQAPNAPKFPTMAFKVWFLFVCLINSTPCVKASFPPTPNFVLGCLRPTLTIAFSWSFIIMHIFTSHPGGCQLLKSSYWILLGILSP